jgi:hypothetical protein
MHTGIIGQAVCRSPGCYVQLLGVNKANIVMVRSGGGITAGVRCAGNGAGYRYATKCLAKGSAGGLEGRRWRTRCIRPAIFSCLFSASAV